MSRYIDADRLEECMRIVQKANKDSVDFNKRCRVTDVFLDIWDMIKKQPTADVVDRNECTKCVLYPFKQLREQLETNMVEVVMCKDCKHYECNGDTECELTHRHGYEPSDFCSNAERREDVD